MLVALICQSMKDGLSARKACAVNGVARWLIHDWCEQNEEFKRQYDLAHEALIRHWEDDLIEIADTTHEGIITKQDHNGVSIESRDAIEHRKLRIQTRQWLMSKLKPKRYGDKLALGGADDLPPVRTKADLTIAPEDAYKEMLGIGNGRS